jgi:hypothetical protein
MRFQVKAGDEPVTVGVFAGGQMDWIPEALVEIARH